MRSIQILLLLISSSSFLSAQSLSSVLNKMHTAIANGNVLTYQMISNERFGSRMVRKKMNFRFKRSPFKVYAKDLDTGVEILYVKNWNNNKAFINPNGFPWVNVSLNIYGYQVRKDGHHVLNRVGFQFFSELLQLIKKDMLQQGYQMDELVKFNPDASWNGQSCYRLEFENPNYRMEAYTCNKTESLHQLCNRLYLPEYRVMELNNLKYSSVVTKGKKIKVPSLYAKKAIFYIDKKSHLPILQIIYDDKGVYERYEFLNLKINPSLNQEEWTTKCTSYGF